MARLDTLVQLTGELVRVHGEIEDLARQSRVEQPDSPFATRLEATSKELSRTARRLHEETLDARLVRVDGLFDRFSRLAWELGRRHGKEIDLRKRGGDVEVDKGVADLLTDPLTHLVRNAIAHGIEAPGERKARGKPVAGTIWLEARSEGRMLRIDVVDDGGGLNIQRITDAAVARGLVGRQDADKLSTRDRHQLVFEPRVSTAENASDLAGRGVGLDLVRANMRHLGGTVEVESEPGHSTRFSLLAPSTLTVARAEVVAVGDQRFAIPARFIEQNLAGAVSTDVHPGEGADSVRDALPIWSLAQLLAVDPGPDGSRHATVVLDAADRRFGLLVDRVEALQELLIRPLPVNLCTATCFSGAATTSSGELILVIDPPGLLRRAPATRSL